MKLKDYAKLINDLVKTHGNKEVAYASDSEGNSFHLVHFGPSVQSVEIDYGKAKKVVCIN